MRAVDFPSPFAPTSATTSPGEAWKLRAAGASVEPSGVSIPRPRATSVRPARRGAMVPGVGSGSGSSRSANAASAAARPSDAAWKCEPTLRRGR